MTENSNLIEQEQLKKLMDKWAKIKKLCPEWAHAIECLDDYRHRQGFKVTPKTNWTLKVGEVDAVTDCLLDMAEKLEKARQYVNHKPDCQKGETTEHCTCGVMKLIPELYPEALAPEDGGKCKHENQSFDRSITVIDGKEIDGMGYYCDDCGERMDEGGGE